MVCKHGSKMLWAQKTFLRMLPPCYRLNSNDCSGEYAPFRIKEGDDLATADRLANVCGKRHPLFVLCAHCGGENHAPAPPRSFGSVKRDNRKGTRLNPSHIS